MFSLVFPSGLVGALFSGLRPWQDFRRGLMLYEGCRGSPGVGPRPPSHPGDPQGGAAVPTCPLGGCGPVGSPSHHRAKASMGIPGVQVSASKGVLGPLGLTWPRNPGLWAGSWSLWSVPARIPTLAHKTQGHPAASKRKGLAKGDRVTVDSGGWFPSPVAWGGVGEGSVRSQQDEEETVDCDG